MLNTDIMAIHSRRHPTKAITRSCNCHFEEGAKANAQGGLYGHALQAASRGGHSEIVQLLLDNGANVNTRNGADRMTPLHIAIEKSRCNVLELLLQSNAPPNTMDLFNRTPLHLAVYSCDLNAAENLVKHGADPNLPDCYGLSSFDWAA